MLLNEKTSIIEFQDRYFIKAGYTSKTLKDEPVRIVYGDITGDPTGNVFVNREVMSFDIYVRNDCMHNATKDGLDNRTELIAERLTKLLTGERYVYNIRFWYVDDHPVGTSTIGYERHNLSLGFLRTAPV